MLRDLKDAERPDMRPLKEAKHSSFLVENEMCKIFSSVQVPL